MARSLVVALLAFAVGSLTACAESGDLADDLEEGYHKLTGAQRFVYVDAEGREVMVEHLENVPDRFRDSVRPLHPDDADPASLLDVFDQNGASDATFYRYTDEGRTVYTNVVEQVPVAQRESGALDLSKISLHTELGNEISRSLREEHRRLTGSAYCGQLRDAAVTSPWRRMWDDYAPLVVCGGLLVAFLLFTPFALRRVDAPVWARTLTTVIPMLALAGLAAFMMRSTNRTIANLSARVRPCTMATWGHLAREDEPYSLAAHARRIADLREQIERATGEPAPPADGDRPVKATP